MEEPTVGEQREERIWNHQLGYGLLGAGLCVVILGLIVMAIKTAGHKKRLEVLFFKLFYKNNIFSPS